MAYISGDPIAAVDFNTFATGAASVNEVFADIHSGATTRAAGADYGYGQTALTSVATGDDITAAQWSGLFTAMKKSGLHQATTVVPPLPSVNPVIGDTITVFNTPSTLATAVALLRTNRFALDPSQSTLVAGTTQTQPGGAKPWTNTLRFTFQVDFGSWNNARYFFNSGGYLGINGTYSGAGTPFEGMLNATSPLKFTQNQTIPNDVTGTTAIGFYELTTSYQKIFETTRGGGGMYFDLSVYRVFAKLNNTAGTDGLVSFYLEFLDSAAVPVAKNTTTTYRIDHLKASGVNVSYPGTVTITPVGGSSGWTTT